jgi:sodium/potassium-transporting ATPase subunit alpha
MSMMDPPRANVPDAIAKCQAAGIKVVMMTGDHPSTAKAIAKSVGILSLDQEPQERTALTKAAQSVVLTGEEMDEFSPDEVDSVLMHYPEIILAGLTAEQKLEVVESCQRLGAVVAVTGDGVNDAAALRRADVGIAMGSSGTDIARDAADMVLLDDNFASVVVAIEEGRIMFDNLKKVLFYTLVSNVAELAPFILFLIAQIPLPLGALAVLCIDLGTDLLPAISLAYDEEEVARDAMKRGPRNPLSDGLLDERLIYLSCAQMGLIHAAAGFFTYFVMMAENGFWPSRLLGLRKLWESRAINDLRDSYDQEWTYDDRKQLEYSCHAGFFFSIVLCQWVVLFVCRARRLSVFQRGMSNGVLNFAVFFETAVAIVLIYLPGLNNGLQLAHLNPISWLPPLPFMALILVYDEIRKAIIRKHPGGWIERETSF